MAAVFVSILIALILSVVHAAVGDPYIVFAQEIDPVPSAIHPFQLDLLNGA